MRFDQPRSSDMDGSGLLEYQRRSHELVDHLEEAITSALIQQPKTHKGRLLQEHFVATLLDQIVQNANRLEKLLQDEESRQADIDLITVFGEPGDMGNFYEHLRAVKDQHRRLESTIEDLVETEAIISQARLTDEALGKLFSGEESLGRFLDLQQPYDLYINLKDIHRIEYLTFLDECDQFHKIATSLKSSPQYKSYLGILLSYLEGFFERAKPLFNLTEGISAAKESFEESWAEASVPGWESFAQNEREDIYCQACQKQFYNPSVFKAHLTGKKHLKAAANLVEKDVSLVATGWAKEIAMMEYLIRWCLECLDGEREETKNHVEAKQSRSSAERALDIEREETLANQTEAPTGAGEQDEDDEMDPKIWNPLNLPLDWDGKPIPYWLWKLHGLGTRYPCEICGNQVYMGRRAFDQHFYEWRHAHGLKCLGIPNTRHFFQVTSIQDAQDLWARLKVTAKQAGARPDLVEECEDQHGNVYSRKTFDDLKRQGLI